jgi:hypothetical protein
LIPRGKSKLKDVGNEPVTSGRLLGADRSAENPNSAKSVMGYACYFIQSAGVGQGRTSLRWVSLRKARDEQMFSGMPPIAAGSEPCQNLRSAANGDIPRELRTGAVTGFGHFLSTILELMLATENWIRLAKAEMRFEYNPLDTHLCRTASWFVAQLRNAKCTLFTYIPRLINRIDSVSGRIGSSDPE